MRYHIFFGSVLFIAAVTGCNSTPLNPGAESVRILQDQPKGCKYLGEVTGNQGNFFTGAYTSNENLETGARNDMKNQAYKLGGNVLVYLTNRAGQTNGRDSGMQTNVTLSGIVYKCPADILNKI